MAEVLYNAAHVVSAAALGVRYDGRPLDGWREMEVDLSRVGAGAVAEVRLGPTVAVAVVTCALGAPDARRPGEGAFAVAASDDGVSRFLERCYRGGCVDGEALCVAAGRAAWSVRCDARVVNDGGNARDALALACGAALRHCRLPRCEVDGDGNATVRDADAANALPLPLLRVPLCVSLALSPGRAADARGYARVADPSAAEAAAAVGEYALAFDAHGGVCALDFSGAPAEPAVLAACAADARKRCAALHDALDRDLAAADAADRADRAEALKAAARG